MSLLLTLCSPPFIAAPPPKKKTTQDNAGVIYFVEVLVTKASMVMNATFKALAPAGGPADVKNFLNSFTGTIGAFFS